AAGVLSSLRSQLLAWLEGHPSLTDCSLYCDVQAIRIPLVADDKDPNDAAAMSTASNALIRALSRAARACFCGAINPPCPPCDDPAVLLACLSVEDCTVVSVCNTERKWVLTGPALRYWIPTIGQIGQAVERACCASPGNGRGVT